MQGTTVSIKDLANVESVRNVAQDLDPNATMQPMYTQNLTNSNEMGGVQWGICQKRHPGGRARREATVAVWT